MGRHKQSVIIIIIKAHPFFQHCKKNFRYTGLEPGHASASLHGPQALSRKVAHGHRQPAVTVDGGAADGRQGRGVLQQPGVPLQGELGDGVVVVLHGVAPIFRPQRVVEVQIHVFCRRAEPWARHERRFAAGNIGSFY